MILYRLDDKGGFTCGDTETRLTAYAYPSSPAAAVARHSPRLAAERMLRHESPSCRRAVPSLRERDERWLAELEAASREAVS